MARGSASYQTGQKDVTNSATLLVPARGGRISVVLSPMGTVNCYFGKAGVTPQTGLFSPGGAPVTLDTADEIYCVSDGDTRVSYVEYY